jgi:excisionase family DNA binding protein
MRRVMTVAEAAAVLGWSEDRVRRACQTRKLPAAKVTGQWSVFELEEWIRNQTRDTTPSARPEDEAIRDLLPARMKFAGSQ